MDVDEAVGERVGLSELDRATLVDVADTIEHLAEAATGRYEDGPYQNAPPALSAWVRDLATTRFEVVVPDVTLPALLDALETRLMDTQYNLGLRDAIREHVTGAWYALGVKVDGLAGLTEDDRAALREAVALAERESHEAYKAGDPGEQNKYSALAERLAALAD